MEHSLDIADSSVVMSNKGPTHAEAPPSPGSPSGSDDEPPQGRKRFRSGGFAKEETRLQVIGLDCSYPNVVSSR